MSELTIYEMQKGDIHRFRDLYKDVWGYTRPRDFDFWRLFQTPHGVCPTAVALDGEKFAGLYTLWPISLNLGGEVVVGAQSMDTMTHPDYQGKGLFTKLALASYEIAAGRGIKAMYGFPNVNSYPGFVRRLNWDHTGDIWHYIRPLKISRHPRIPAFLGAPADIITKVWPAGKKSNRVIGSTKPPWSEVSTLLSTIFLERGICRIERSEAWFDWRYSKNAMNNYTWLSCRSYNGTLVAVAIWGMRSSYWGKSADNRAHLVELFGSDPDAISDVLAESIRQAREAGALLMETICQHPQSERALRQAGFLRHRRAPFITRKLTAENLLSNIHTHNAWYIFGGDIDTF